MTDYNDPESVAHDKVMQSCMRILNLYEYTGFNPHRESDMLASAIILARRMRTYINEQIEARVSNEPQERLYCAYVELPPENP